MTLENLLSNVKTTLKPMEKSNNPPKIPKFHKKQTESLLGTRFRTQYVIKKVFKMKEQSLLSNVDIDTLIHKLSEHATMEFDGRWISYMGFCTVRDQLDDKFSVYLRPCIFTSFRLNKNHQINLSHYEEYVLRRASLIDARFNLARYDGDNGQSNSGKLSEEQLQNYIKDLMPTLHLTVPFSESFKHYYAISASRKFLFFLDPLRKGEIPIQSILLSPILTELFELRDPNLDGEEADFNWFTAKNILSLYKQFKTLDSDDDGLLTREEFSSFDGSIYTPLFLDRLFQEYVSGDRLDFIGYLNFILAVDNLFSKESIKYLFKPLDMYSRGYLDKQVVTTFVKAVSDRLYLFSQAPIHCIEDVVDEIFDMSVSKVSGMIDVNDLIDCGMGATIIGIMMDCNSFLQHDKRENPENLMDPPQ